MNNQQGSDSSRAQSEQDRFYTSVVNRPSSSTLFSQSEIYENYTRLINENSRHLRGLMLLRKQATGALHRIAAQLEGIHQRLVEYPDAPDFAEVNARRNNLCECARGVRKNLERQSLRAELELERQELFKAQDAQNVFIMKKKIVSYEEEIEGLTQYLERYERPLLPEGKTYADWKKLERDLSSYLALNRYRITSLEKIIELLESGETWEIQCICERAVLTLIDVLRNSR